MTVCSIYRWCLALTVLVASGCVTTHTWTNCAQPEGCKQIAVLDIPDPGIRTDIVDADGTSLATATGQAQSHSRNNPLFLTPGTYTIRSETSDSEWTTKREDTFPIAAGHSYRQMSRSCTGIYTSLSSWCKEGRFDAETIWFEDVAASSVVAGEKWCQADADCPESTCSRDSGRSLGICRIAGLECKSAAILGKFGTVIGESGRCEPAAEDGKGRDWPGFPNFQQAAPPDSTHSLVYIYSPEDQAAFANFYEINIQSGSIDRPTHIAMLPTGSYLPYYVSPGTMTLRATRSDIRDPQSSATLNVRPGETYYIRGVLKQSWHLALIPKLQIVSSSEGLAELRHCRLISIEPRQPDPTPLEQ